MHRTMAFPPFTSSSFVRRFSVDILRKSCVSGFGRGGKWELYLNLFYIFLSEKRFSSSSLFASSLFASSSFSSSSSYTPPSNPRTTTQSTTAPPPSSSPTTFPTNPPKAQENEGFSRISSLNLDVLSEETVKALQENFMITSLTENQWRLLQHMRKGFGSKSSGCRVFLQSKTGTGKTLAYLLSIAAKMNNEGSLERETGVYALIIVPIRELAFQVAREAEKFFRYHNIEVLALTGSSTPEDDERLLRMRRPQLIVATPGRLLYHLQGTFMFSTLFEDLRFLILDEADRLFQVGMLATTRSILCFLKSHNPSFSMEMLERRNTIIVSATLLPKIKDIAEEVGLKDYSVLDCIGSDIQIPDAISQSLIVTPPKLAAPMLYCLLKEEILTNEAYKVMVFFPTGKMTEFFCHFFREQFRLKAYQLHRRRDAIERKLVAERFSEDQNGILFTSDVSARGLDYANVSLIIQVGCPTSCELYVHRVGRTGRGIGKGGRAITLSLEGKEDDAADTPSYTKELLERFSIDFLYSKDTEKLFTGTQSEIFRAQNSWDSNVQLHLAASTMYASLLSYYKASQARFSLRDDEIIRICTQILVSCGIKYQPAVSRELAALLCLEENSNLKITQDLTEDYGIAPPKNYHLSSHKN